MCGWRVNVECEGDGNRDLSTRSVESKIGVDVHNGLGLTRFLHRKHVASFDDDDGV